MKVLIAPDSFKGTLTATEAGELMAAAIREAFPESSVVVQPISDGGEGFVEACHYDLGELIPSKVVDPLGKPITSYFLKIAGTGILEMARTSGMELIPTSQLDPLHLSTYGTGEQVLAALHSGCDHLILGLGGSATHDGAMGCLRALGVDFLDDRGNSLNTFLQTDKIRSIKTPDFLVQPTWKLTIAADVTNPLLGPQGAARLFSPQKGAGTPEIVDRLEKMTSFYADIVERETGKSCRQVEGAGAAGGMGFGLMCFMNAKIVAGYNIVADLTGMEEKIRAADVVITGEGKFDSQSSYGKAPVRLCKQARELGKKCLGIFGILDAVETPFNGYSTLTQIAGDEETAISQAEKYVGPAVVRCLKEHM